MLKIKGLKVNVEGKPILSGVDLEVNENTVHALMGPNGSGKSTLAQAIVGHPYYEVVGGSIIFDGEKILKLEPDQRALRGIFLSFQYPSEISGVTISNFLRLIYNKSHDTNISPAKFRPILKEKMKVLDIPKSFSERYLNEGFSGGEKKRMEVLQMLVLEPKLAILDETDSGLDIDAVKTVAKSVNTLRKQTKMSVLIITHYIRILKYIKPDVVSIMRDGEIVKQGDKGLARELEKKGYAPFGSSSKAIKISKVKVKK